MTTSTLPYPAYKPSGIQWLGDVPEHWDVRRLKFAVKINPETLSEDTSPGYEFEYVDISSVGSGILLEAPVQQRFDDAPSRARRVFRKGDTVISTVRTYLKASYHLETDWPKLIASTGFAVLRPPGTVLPALLKHLVQCESFVEQVVANSVGVAYPAISEGKLANVSLPLPPLPEQQAIVRYLDHVDGRIRRLVDAKRRLIALLEEERQAVINQAVTRGLDPNVPLKPSGVDWIGDIPAHWEAKQLGRIGRFSKGSGGTKEDEVGSGVPCVRYGDLYTSHKYHVRRTRTFISNKQASAYTQIQFGDILFAGSGETLEEIGKSAVNLIQGEARCGGDVIILRPSLQMDASFSGFLVDSRQAQLQKSAMGRGFTVMHIYSSELKYLWVALPPINEQTAIVAHIEEATGEIDSAIGKTRRQIELLEEYRTRLIADVVTGKLDVRKAAALLPEELAD